MADAPQFKLDLKRFIEQEVPARAAEIQGRMSAELFTAIVQATPVGNHRTWQANRDRATRGLAPLPKGYVGGHARKNWQMKVGSPATTELPGVDKTGAQAQSAAYQVAASIKKPARVFISNPLPYIDRLENGWSKQAPRGMVRQAIAAVTAKYRRVS